MHQYQSKNARFSNRALLTHAAGGLPQSLTLKPRAANAPAEIMIYDEIGFWGITAKDFVAMLAQAGEGDIVVRINSPGGDVFDGLAIFSAMSQHKGNVSVIIDGLAASAASYIAMAGSSITIAKNAFMMIHNAWGVVIGNRNDMRDAADVMDKIDNQIASIYADKSGKPVADFADMMTAETWFTAQEAIDVGLADTILQGESTAAMAALKPGVFENAPDLAALTPVPDTNALACRRRLARLVEAESAA